MALISRKIMTWLQADHKRAGASGRKATTSRYRWVYWASSRGGALNSAHDPCRRASDQDMVWSVSCGKGFSKPSFISIWRDRHEQP